MQLIKPSKLIHWLLNPASALSQRVVHAGFWALALRIGLRLLSTIRIIILARLLAPEDFGLVGVATIIMVFLETFTQTGFKAALIQRTGDIRPYLDTAWTIGILRNILLAAIMILGAPIFAALLNVPSATTVIRVMALVLVLDSLGNVGVIYFLKELELHKRFISQMASNIVAIVVGITLALTLQNVWALVYSTLAGSAMAVVISYLIHPYRPHLLFDKAKALELFRFGRWVFLNTVLYFLAVRGDGVVVSRMLGPVALGTYQLGRTFTELTTREIASVVAAVAFPAYAQVQDELPRLRRAYFMSLEAVAAITFPIAVLSILLAEPITKVVLGEQWLTVASVIPALAAAASIRAVAATGGSLYAATGLPRLDFQMSLLRVVVIFVLIVPLMSIYGLAGASWAVLAGALAVLPFFVWYTCRTLQVSVLQLGRSFLPAVALSVFVTLSLMASRLVFDNNNIGFLELVSIIIIAGGSYLVGSLLIWKTVQRGPVQVLMLLRSRA